MNIIRMQTKSEMQYYYNNTKSDINKKIYEVLDFIYFAACRFSQHMIPTKQQLESNRAEKVLVTTSLGLQKG